MEPSPVNAFSVHLSLFSPLQHLNFLNLKFFSNSLFHLKFNWLYIIQNLIILISFMSFKTCLSLLTFAQVFCNFYASLYIFYGFDYFNRLSPFCLWTCFVIDQSKDHRQIQFQCHPAHQILHFLQGWEYSLISQI